MWATMGVTTSGWLMLAAAPSKVPFYIAGGLLVVWAVLLAAWGISHADFPGSPGRARLVMFTSFLLVAATMTAAGGTLALAADPAGALRFDKTRAAVLTGRVTVRLTNDSSVEHNVTIAQGSKTLAATKTITESTDTLALELAPGDYVFFCSVAGHRESGMQGTLTVD
jgi:plastocyanin